MSRRFQVQLSGIGTIGLSPPQGFASKDDPGGFATTAKTRQASQRKPVYVPAAGSAATNLVLLPPTAVTLTHVVLTGLLRSYNLRAPHIEPIDKKITTKQPNFTKAATRARCNRGDLEATVAASSPLHRGNHNICRPVES